MVGGEAVGGGQVRTKRPAGGAQKHFDQHKQKQHISNLGQQIVNSKIHAARNYGKVSGNVLLLGFK